MMKIWPLALIILISLPVLGQPPIASGPAPAELRPSAAQPLMPVRQLGVMLFAQDLKSTLQVKDTRAENNAGREFIVDPLPPTQLGVEISMAGFGVGYAYSQDETLERPSKFKGFEYKIPIENFLLEIASLEIEGADVRTRGYVDDVEVESFNATLSWSFDEFDFSWLYGLAEELDWEERAMEGHHFLIAYYEKVNWSSSQSFFANGTGADDELSFNEFKRSSYSFGYGYAFLKPLKKARFTGAFNAGPNISDNERKYTGREPIEKQSWGINLGASISAASNYGLDSIIKKTGIYLSYGFDMSAKLNSDFQDINVQTTIYRGRFYLGGLW